MIEIVLGAIALLLLLFLSAVMSSGEVAFFSLLKTDLESLKKNDKNLYQKVVLLLNNPEKLLATILTGNNFVNIAFVIVSYSNRTQN